MASYNKFNAFTQDLVNAKHNFGSNTVKVMLTNTAPSATNAVKADITEITAGSGYTAGGTTTTISVSTIGPLRYAVVYNATTATNPLISWFDYGSSITLNDTETLTVDFDNTNGLFTVT